MNTTCRHLCIAALLWLPALTCAKGLTIWPLIAELPPGSKAVAIYLDNQSDTAQQLQIRVKQWQQLQHKDQFSEQQTVLVSPPFVSIEPRQRQLVRLVYLNAGQVPVLAAEQSYRVLIDDVTAVNSKTGSQVHIRMRYSLPLFVGRPAEVPATNDAQPFNAYWQDKIQASLQLLPDGSCKFSLQNTGPSHLRLSQVQLIADGQPLWSAGEGLFSYLLANTEFSWTIGPEPTLQHTLTAGSQLQLQFESYRVPLTFPVAVISGSQ
ncbi:molecular chaperone [Rheinheimera riviphila]|uniref:Molecular chaperone n=1 Tax=Rheinheimera riviphila TaxID=1834037 RepID=A0A437QFV4_9GAMM|nr:fimbria/pilus periplasmic chaperone [Rheinheimera riviphila]RVU33421.1 molecular chaperone [Rheinheimera riviphila]